MVSFRNSGLFARSLQKAGIQGLILGLCLLASGPSFAAVDDSCHVPEAYLDFYGSLDRTERLVFQKKPVRIAILGPVFGVGAPHQFSLEKALEKRLPGVGFHITQVLSHGLAEDDFTQMRQVVKRFSPDLVIWQVGVPDAIAASNVGEFERVLDQATSWVDRRGVDLILVDPPFVPNVRHERIYTPYVGEIGELSRSTGIPTLRRYAAMQYLVSEAQKERRSAEHRTPCMPELMAEAILRAVRD